MAKHDLKRYFKKQYPQKGIPEDFFITFDEYIERQRLLEKAEHMKKTPISLLFSIYDRRYRYSYDGDEMKVGDVILVFQETDTKQLQFIAERNLHKLDESHEFVTLKDDSVIPNFKMKFEYRKKQFDKPEKKVIVTNTK